jgi:cytoskeletal protein CcmA (bactofilin family)
MPEPIRQNAPAQTITVIGADTHIKGEMAFEGNARILGTFEGQISTKGELQVAESATCRATVDAQKVLLEGTIEGNVNVREKMEMSPKARMRGDIVATRLVVMEGAVFTGHVTVGDGASKGQPRNERDRGESSETNGLMGSILHRLDPVGNAR